jgi:hypothetical protein
MDYVHRKVPVKQELETNDISKPKLAPTALNLNFVIGYSPNFRTTA